MPRDMAGTGRHPPAPRHPPIAFYAAVRLGDAECLEAIMRCDAYFVTQDNGSGAPLHFAVTYNRLDMVCGAGRQLRAAAAGAAIAAVTRRRTRAARRRAPFLRDFSGPVPAWPARRASRALRNAHPSSSHRAGHLSPPGSPTAQCHHLLNNGAEVNQRDAKGFTPLHRAAHLAHLDGYAELYEFLLSRGADPTIVSEEHDPYLRPGRRTPLEVAPDDSAVRARLAALEAAYAGAPRARRPHADIGDWWALYDYGPEVVAAWPVDYVHPYPGASRACRARGGRGWSTG